MADTSKSKSPLWMRLTLLVSIALNVLIIGAAVGFVLTGGPDRKPDRDRTDFGSFYMRALTDDDRRALRREFVSDLQKQGRDRGAVLVDLRTTLDTLRASPFDPDAFASAMAEQSRARAQRDEMGRQILANRIARMSDAERGAYADRIEDRLHVLENRIRR